VRRYPSHEEIRLVGNPLDFGFVFILAEVVDVSADLLEPLAAGLVERQFVAHLTRHIIPSSVWLLVGKNAEPPEMIPVAGI
jgi:hypothetical protein